MSSASSGKYELLDRLAEEFAQRWRRGERPSLQEYVDRYPELADDIRALFPALAEVEQVDEDRHEATDRPAPVTPPLERLGDYRIIREIGRGGMGVVYEAEQLSLGRRVALKVLPLHSGRDGKALERFKREARAAAKLHHTNIVPVFEVGQEGEITYYAMQFIQGLGLDLVVAELRRLRADSAAGRLTPPVEQNGGATCSDPVWAAAQSLLTGHFRQEHLADASSHSTPAVVAEGNSAAGSGEASSAVVLPGQAELASGRSGQPRYFASVARIGQQAAEALAYAHARGVIHRDVKPSNLLLDAAGVVWVTDFGLAKTEEEGLTQAGDLVGTLRYMAPERFRGECDARADLYAVFFHSLASGRSTQVTDGRSDARDPQFDATGKYLFFSASTDAGPAMGGIEMSNFNHPVTRSVYLIVLNRTLPSPLSPESDEEKGGEEGKKPEKPAKPLPEGKDKTPKRVLPKVRIDLEDIDQRIIALPVPARNYVTLLAGKAGVLFLLEMAQRPVGVTAGPEPPKLTLHRFDLEKRKVEPFVETSGEPVLSRDGEKLLYRSGEKWFLVGTTAAPKPGEGALKVEELEVRIDPRAEWKQIYREVWRIERDFLYDPGFHGYDLKAAEKRFLPYLEQVASRRDLNYLFGQMLSELSLGHVYVAGGDLPEVKGVKGGLLGADYTLDSGRYRFSHVYRGENWNPDLRAPLTQPGVNVKASEYLLAVNGQEVKAPENVYRFFEGTAGKSVVLRVGPSADGKGARDVTAVPVASELGLRNRAWIESNRRKVDALTNGRVAYVYLPDTGAGGYTNFNRYFFAQVDKEGVVIDERFNGGGKAADYIIERLRRPLLNYWSTRYGADYTTPAGAIFGPKAMIINELAGSGGDYLPWAFRRFKLGPLVGKRTWGGLVGIGGYPPLLDGGTVTAPHFAFWTPEGEWEVENRGVAPDVEVEHDPKAVRAGRDLQLEKAVQLVVEALEKNPLPKAKRPAYPNYHPKANAEGGLTPPAGVKDQSFHWPSFRGPGGSGIAEGQHPLPCRHNSVIVAAVMRWV